MRDYTVATLSVEDEAVSSLELKPGKRPRDLGEAIAQVNAWKVFHALDLDAYKSAALRSFLVTDAGFGLIIERLQELRQRDDEQ